MKAWYLIIKLNGDQTVHSILVIVASNHIISELLKHGKSGRKIKRDTTIIRDKNNE